MVQILPQEGSLASNVGAGLGKGLSEQLPKEFQQQRLSAGIKNLAKKDLSKASPLELLSELQGIGGMTPELAASYLPYIQNQMARKGIEKRAIDETKPSTTVTAQKEETPVQGVEPIQEEAKPLQENGFATRSQIDKYKQGLLQPANTQQINQRAQELIQYGVTQDPNQALQMADTELNRERNVQQQKNTQTEAELSKRIGLTLQKGPLGSDASFQGLVGDIQKELIDQALVLQNQFGMTPEAAAQKIDEVATQLGETALQTKALGAISNFSMSPSEKLADLKAQRSVYKKYGFTKQFDDIAAASFDISPQKMASEVDPIKNKEINAILDNFKKQSFSSKVLQKFIKEGNRRHPGSFKVGIRNDKIPQRQLDNLIDKIKPDDNILSIEEALKERGLDISQFKNRLSEMQDENKKALTPLQHYQEQKPVPQSMFGDFWWNARS